MTTTFLDAALRALELGHTPIPITPNQKHPPLVPWKDFQDRQPTEDEVRKWWRKTPEANLALVTGKTLDVIDVDPDKNGKLPEWPDIDCDLPVECVASTPRGGLHYLCQHTPGIKNSASQVAPHVDVRGEGGYILIAPSVVDGKPYEFVLGNLAEITNPFPAWLLDQIKSATNGSHGTEISPSEAAKIFDTFNQPVTNTKYGLTALRDEIRKIKAAPEGARNDTLNHASFALGQLILANQLDRLTVEQKLFSAATEVGLKPTEIQATITSGLSAGGMKPRTNATKTKKQNQGILPPAECASAWMQEVLEAPGIILSDLFDIGTKAALMGPSKSRKSYMLLQWFISLAAGLDRFLVWDIERPRRVLIVQLEITAYHFHKRLIEVCKGLKVEPDQLEDRLQIINARGVDLDQNDMPRIIELAKKHKADVVCVDPIYKMLTGDESDQAAVKPLLKSFDLLCEATGASFVYSHHYAKGLSGDKATVDRGSGSGILARDYDIGIYLGHHKMQDLLVCEAIARSYPPWEPFSIKWENNNFKYDPTPPIVQTSMNSRASGRLNGPVTPDKVMEMFEHGCMPLAVFEQRMSELCTIRRMRSLRSQLIDAGQLQKARERGKTTGQWYIGTPVQIRDFHEELAAEANENWDKKDNRGCGW